MATHHSAYNPFQKLPNMHVRSLGFMKDSRLCQISATIYYTLSATVTQTIFAEGRHVLGLRLLSARLTLNECNVCSLQVMLLGSSLQLPQPVLMIPLPSDALLMEGWVGPPPGEWEGWWWMSVPCNIDWLAHLCVGLAVLSQLRLQLGLEQMLLLTHLHWVALQSPHWMVDRLSALDQT